MKEPIFGQADGLSSIRANPTDELLPALRKLWPIYLETHAPAALDASEPITHLLTLFRAASTKPYFKLLSSVTDETSQYYEVNVDYGTLAERLEREGDELSKELADVFSSFCLDCTVILQALQLILHWQLEEAGKNSKKVRVTISNFPVTELIELRAHMMDSFVSVQAAVVKVQQIRLMAVCIEFVCFECKTAFWHYFKDGAYSTPGKCRNPIKQCRSRIFTPSKDKMKNIFVQRIKVQEIDAEGRVPRQMSCELREDQVGRLITGETVVISGTLRTEAPDERDKKTKGIFTPYMQVNHFAQLRSGEIASDDVVVVQRMRNDKTIFYSLIKSFCPTIFGHELVKAGLLLGMVGGSERNIHHEAAFRETSHVLLLGDPGIGKSQLLKFAVQILHHSVYVSGPSMSASGLTVAVNKEKGSEQALEAGALIQADNGVCAIDEFDKASDQSALLEVMEQQTISIAKAGIICQLKCRTGIIASANPTQGCYNKNKTFMENTKISNAILSRFDLIFLMLDKPDPHRDKKLSEHIMSMHSHKRKKDSIPVPRQFEAMHENASYLSLNEKYTRLTELCAHQYRLPEIKKYLSFIRTSIHPTLSRGAADILKAFYILLRDNSPSTSFQITSRQLESLVRLAMARARIECREEVSEEDAYEVTQLMQESLFDSFEEMGYNINSLKQGAKNIKVSKKNNELSLPKQRQLFVNTLRDMQEEREGRVWEWSELVQVARELQLSIGDFHNFIQRLNQDGVLLQKGSKKYCFQGTYV